MKKIIFICAFLLMPIQVHASERLVVVELFTSQGCSSCPPADVFLGELSMRKDVLALAYHVDYWDYIGWDDVHAKAAFTQRQREYAKAFNLRYIYTPQMLVSGEYETSGNNRLRIIRAVERDLQKQQTIAMTLTPEGTLQVDGNISSGEVNVFQVSYLKEVTTEVRRGENRGKTLTDYHIVSDLHALGQWRGGKQSFTLVPRAKDKEYAVFLQSASDLKILGAMRLNN